VGVVIVAIIAVVLTSWVVPTISTAHAERAAAEQRYQFLNQGNENLLYDFNYLMWAMEENWPFFNLSISANGVDVHALADNVRRILSDPATEDMGPHAFLDFLRENFIWPINQLGHLNTTWRYQAYFNYVQVTSAWANHLGDTSTDINSQMELLTRPQVVMFYETLRDAGGSTLVNPADPPPSDPLPVYETAILEEGSIAYLAVSRMIAFWDDPNPMRRRIGEYGEMLLSFHEDIEGFEHLIIDMRGNPGGSYPHFTLFGIGPLLHELITLPAYIFYKGGDYSRMAREDHDLRIFGSDVPFVQHVASFDEPLPYLDTEMELPYVFYSTYAMGSAYELAQFSDFMRPEVLFNGTVWFLIDERTGSSAEAAVALMKLNNLATVVGEPSFGIFGTTSDPTQTSVALPNTGILVRMDVAYFTDIHGRPLQGYGLIPHYHNRPGMDALETVLAMIAEGAY